MKVVLSNLQASGRDVDGGVLTEVLYEPFLSGTNDAAGEYDPGVLLTGQGPVNPPFTGNWTLFNATSGIRTVASGLSYLSLPVAGGSIQNLNAEEATDREVSSGPLAGDHLAFSFLHRSDGNLAGVEFERVDLKFSNGATLIAGHLNQAGQGFFLNTGSNTFSETVAPMGQIN